MAYGTFKWNVGSGIIHQSSSIKIKDKRFTRAVVLLIYLVLRAKKKELEKVRNRTRRLARWHGGDQLCSSTFGSFDGRGHRHQPADRLPSKRGNEVTSKDHFRILVITVNPLPCLSSLNQAGSKKTISFSNKQILFQRFSLIGLRTTYFYGCCCSHNFMAFRNYLIFGK